MNACLKTAGWHQASLWAKYRLTAFGLNGVTVGGGVRSTGESWDGTDTIRTPDYTLFDAMVRYETGPWRFQVHASNIADKRHSPRASRAATASTVSAARCWGARRTGSSA
jgi:iron complex outermembrane recepter protein